MGKVFYQNVYGLRVKKYEYLNRHYVVSTKWEKLQPSEPHYFFEEKKFAEQSKYNTFLSIQDIFGQSSSGVTTHRDHFVVGFTKEEIKQRIRTFTSDLPDELVRQTFDLGDTHDFNLKDARGKLNKADWKESILPYLYRPFDSRYVCYRPELIDRDRHDIMQHFVKENLGLVVMRQYLYEPVKTYNYVFCVDKLSDRRLFISNRGAGFIFPLHLYQKKDNPKKSSLANIMLLFEPEAEYGVKKPNLSPALIGNLSKTFKKGPFPEEIFYYVYAVLYSETYRTKYAAFLKIDFPRVPFTRDYKLFKKMSEYGNMLVDLHLLKSLELNSPIARFQGKGDNRVEKPRYDENAEMVYINKTRYFEGIPPDVWTYQIGGYQVCDKWLKDRKERILSLDEIQTYCRIVTAIQKTIEIQKGIDSFYKEIEKTV